jgi:hypothetical protein
MYKILCLTSGQYIHLGNQFTMDSNYFTFNWLGIDSMLDSSIYVNDNTGLLWFDNKASADWFIRRRLTHNSKRSNAEKIGFMVSIFEASGINHWKTNKLEFEAIEENIYSDTLRHIHKQTGLVHISKGRTFIAKANHD